MAKKSKENNNSDTKTSSKTNPKNIFTKLFGNTPEDENAASIFSDSNPFRRKPQQNPPKIIGFVENPIAKNPIIEKNSKIEENNSDEQKIKKRVNEKSEKFGDDLDQEAVKSSKKVKKLEKDQNLEVKNQENLGFGLGLEKDQNLEVKNEEDLGLEKKRKKRKRDEVEVEYEKKVYGVGGEEEKGNVGVGVGEKRKKRENPEELMVSKEGFDDEDKLLRTVFVGNLQLKIKKKVLVKEFGVFGEIESVRIRSVPILDSKTPRKGAIMKKQINESADSVHAYIVFKTVESAEGALAHNMAVVGGNHIRVDRACPPRKKLKGDSSPLYDNKRTIFVGNLPFDVKDEELYQLFTRIKGMESSLEAVRVIRDPNSSLGKGIAYVLFKTKETANMVIRRRDLRLRDRELRISQVKLNSTPKKIQTVSPGKGVISSKRGSAESGTPGSNMQNNKATMSYQGLRASKSGVSKKTSTNTGRRVNLNASNQKAKEPSDRKRKRPAVAARKAKALKSDSALETSGMKRKLGNRTPESPYQKKKARRN